RSRVLLRVGRKGESGVRIDEVLGAKPNTGKSPEPGTGERIVLQEIPWASTRRAVGMQEHWLVVDPQFYPRKKGRHCFSGGRPVSRLMPTRQTSEAASAGKIMGTL